VWYATLLDAYALLFTTHSYWTHTHYYAHGEYAILFNACALLLNTYAPKHTHTKTHTHTHRRREAAAGGEGASGGALGVRVVEPLVGRDVLVREVRGLGSLAHDPPAYLVHLRRVEAMVEGGEHQDTHVVHACTQILKCQCPSTFTALSHYIMTFENSCQRVPRGPQTH
jgi:hypothetical protein